MIKLKKQHNDFTKEFLQKILLFIDASLIEAVSASKEDKNKILVSGLVNVKDAIFSEVVKDRFTDQINQSIDEIESKKNQQSKEEEIDSSQEIKLDNDQ